MRPRANTISHVDGNAMQMLAAANVSAARGMPPTHSRHPSLAGLPVHGLEHTYAGMSSAMGQRGVAHSLPKLETHGINGMDFSSGLRTAPPMAVFNPDFDFEGILFGPGSTINPNALHYNDSPQSMALDPTSPFPHTLADMSTSQHLDDSFDWLTGFEHQMSFNTNENAVDGSSPSAISTTSQSGISDVMLDGSNHPPPGTSSMWQPAVMGPPQVPTNPFSMDLSGSVFPDLMNGAPVSPQPAAQKISDPYFSTPPPSLTSLSPSIVSGMNTQNLNQALSFNAGPETPSSINGGNHGVSPVSTITDATRASILNALAQVSPFGTRKYSFTSTGSPLSPGFQNSPNAIPDHLKSLPSTQDLQRYIGAYLHYFHPHLPFLHVPTLSFDMPPPSPANRANTVGGSGCLILSMAAIGALYELDHGPSRELFEMAKKMIQLYLEERRKADVRKADHLRRTPGADHNSQGNAVHTPVWLVQAMLLNVVYGHNCGDKTASDIASTHSAALVSLAQAADLLRPIRVEASEKQDATMADDNGQLGSTKTEAEEQAEWLKWKTAEERKRTLYVVFIMSSLLVIAYNHTPALTNSEILLDLPCDEEFYSAESSTSFLAKGGVRAAHHNRSTFHEALGELLRTNEKQQKQLAFANGNQAFGSTGNVNEISKGELKPSSFGCMILIYALHNYIWETRQRHHNKVWTNEETEKMHRHIEPALKAWQAAWARNPSHSLERPNPFGLGPLSADSIPLLDLAYVRLFVNLSRSKEKFWQRDWDGMADELSRGSEIIQHAEHSPGGTRIDPPSSDPSEASVNASSFVDSPPPGHSPSSDFNSGKLQAGRTQTSQMAGRSISRREKHLRKAAFYAADSLAMSDKLGVTFADFTSRELPLQAAICAFDCAQVLSEWVATLQDRVGRYLGILGQDEVDLSQVPAIMLLEEEDVKLLRRVQEVLASAEMKMNLALVSGNIGVDARMQMDEHNGYAAKILRLTAFMMDKAAVWPSK
jgi:hypothetical protein